MRTLLVVSGRLAVAIAPVFAGVYPTAMGQPPSAEVRIARLVDRLGADDYLQRTAADAELARLGQQARGQLRVAAGSEDVEVRVRARALLRRLKVADVWASSSFSHAESEAQASDLLAQLARQTGNRLLVGDRYGKFADARVTLDRPDGSFWWVLDDVCRQTGNTVRPHYDSLEPGWVVTAGDHGRFPTAYAGAVRALVTSARRVFTEELNYRDLDSEQTHTFQLNLTMMWEDRFRLVACRAQPELIEAAGEAGVKLSAGKPTSTGWSTLGRGTQQVTASLKLQPPPVAIGKLDTLKIKWPLIAVGEMATIQIDNLEDGRTHYQDDAQLKVLHVEIRNGRQVNVTLLVTRDLVVPDPREILFQENEFELIDSGGRPYRKQGQTNTFSDGGAQIKINFLGGNHSEPKTLRFSYPKIRTRRDLEIVFRDVPLPVGRPR